ncbi:hypothetical protein ACRW9N_12280 [Listeria aquatica]|uniref:hypothetical protein n=1 Tax=Listeria aquatica TaxID=1494960 RepID=UPI003EF416C9
MEITTTYNGFHGTYKDKCNQIMRDGFVYKHRNNHWLGNGIYFFIDDPHMADIWPKISIRNCRSKRETAILFCKIMVKRERLFDLDTERDLLRFDDYLKQIKKEYRLEFSNVSNEEVRCMVMDTLPLDEDFGAIDAIKYTFSKDSGPRYESEKIGLEPHGPQLCVRNEKCIDTNTLEIYEHSSDSRRR